MKDKVLDFLANNPFGAALRVFVVVVAGLFYQDVQNVGYFHVDLSEWWPWLWAGIAAALPVLWAYLNPKDTRFGRGS